MARDLQGDGVFCAARRAARIKTSNAELSAQHTTIAAFVASHSLFISARPFELLSLLQSGVRQGKEEEGGESC